MYRLDGYDNSLVIDGFQKGIADSPYTGISDMRNMNIISIPGESSVNFSTSKITAPAIASGTVVSADAGADTITYTGASGLGVNMAIVFAGGSLPTGITAGTVYWVSSPSAGTFQIYSNIALTSLVNITATGTGTFTVYTMNQPKHFTYDSNAGAYWMVDLLGQVWTNATTTINGWWVYTGNNAGTGTSVGNGIVYYQASNGTGYIFSFRNSAIDFTPSAILNVAWVYGWNPADATTANAAGYLKTGTGTSNSHEAFVAPTNQVVFCDANWVDRFYEKNPAVAFVPTTASTYVWDQTALLPTTDKAQCLTYLGASYLVGGIRNTIYTWNGTATTFSSVLLLPENSVQKMVTVNTNTYAFVGSRGRIYVTNGSNASLYKKIPDHISGTVEPYFTWGGATFSKNQLYFSFSVTTNGGTTNNQYGGVWAIDTDTNAMRLVNKLSYDTYAGFASAMIPDFSLTPAGTGLFIGWNSGASTYGIDITSSSPYTGSQATIDSDLIPIGTFMMPRDFTKVEYKLSRPMVGGESITIKTRLIFNTTDTGFTTTFTDSTTGNFSSQGDINFRNAQWVQFQIVLNSTASSPSYVRLTEIRILGLTGPSAQQVESLEQPNALS
mgnify:CR=1 FL=1